MADPTTKQRQMFATMGIAMPDGSYYVRNADDLHNAILSVGRGENAGDSGNAIRKHIISRAAKIKLSSQIPATWNPDGSLKHWDLDSYLEHFGVKGMKWGVRRNGGGSSSPKHPVSEDAAKAHASGAVVKKHGVSALSNAELQHLVQRLNLEQQHGKLSPQHVSKGKQIADELLSEGGKIAKQQAVTLATQYVAKGVSALVKEAGTK